ncbi:MAG: radical SAM protein [Desulfovermiculus sp.]
MRLSKYNTFITSKNLGCFVYNALSNTLIEMDEAHYALLSNFQSGHGTAFDADEDFYDLLRKHFVLAEPDEEQDQLFVQHSQRLAQCFKSSSLALTIAPTLRCNFRCPYCFESSQATGRSMDADTRKRLVEWIQQHQDINKLQVTWYGGEPLLAFETICELTESFKALDLQYANAGLITNGYLLDEQKIDKLNELRITSVQITLDGPQEVHDSRRFLAGGGPTYERIIQNIRHLMHSDYSGHCMVRVNVDRNNIQGYLQLRDQLHQEFQGRQLFVYPGHVEAAETNISGRGSCLDMAEWADFNLKLYHEYLVRPPGGIFPKGPTGGMCIATRHNGFVVGPEGELYKCWDDVGQEDMIVGSIHAEKTITNPVLQARYASGLDAYSDPECMDCPVLPICGGGCVNKRLRSKFYGHQGVAYCSPFKNHLRKYLEACIDAVRSQEICSQVLTPGRVRAENPGFQVIFPQQEE